MPKEPTISLTVRLPRKLHQRLERLRKRNGYSINAITVAALDDECRKLEEYHSPPPRVTSFNSDRKWWQQ